MAGFDSTAKSASSDTSYLSFDNAENRALVSNAGSRASLSEYRSMISSQAQRASADLNVNNILPGLVIDMGMDRATGTGQYDLRDPAKAARSLLEQFENNTLVPDAWKDRPIRTGQFSNTVTESSTVDKSLRIAQLVAQGAIEYVRGNPGKVATEATVAGASGLAVAGAIAVGTAAIAAAPVVGTAAVAATAVVGAVLVGKELWNSGQKAYERLQELKPALKTVWNREKAGNDSEYTAAEEKVKEVLGQGVVDVGVIGAAGGIGGKIGTQLGARVGSTIMDTVASRVVSKEASSAGDAAGRMVARFNAERNAERSYEAVKPWKREIGSQRELVVVKGDEDKYITLKGVRDNFPFVAREKFGDGHLGPELKVWAQHRDSAGQIPLHPKAKDADLLVTCHPEAYADPKALAKHVFPNSRGEVYLWKEGTHNGKPLLHVVDRERQLFEDFQEFLAKQKSS